VTVSIATVPSHAAGDQFTQPMWQTLEDNIKGWYRCSAFVQWAAQATSQASEIRFVVNGSTQVTCGLDMNSDNTHPTYHTCSTELYLQAGDQVTVTVVQRSGGTVAVTNATIVVVRV
jgi:hypothetical protein